MGYAALIVTVYGLVNFLGSYAAGMLADRFNRKMLLGIGLLGNAAAIMAMGFTHRYELLLVFAVLAGGFAALYHPAANALIPEHYPRHPGMAIGLLGIGSGIGFFAGPQFAGWRAETTWGRWNLAGISNWQRPLVEAGAAGFLVGVAFLLVAREVKNRHTRFTCESAGRDTDGEHGAVGRVDGQGAETRRNAPDEASLEGKKLGWRVAAIAAVLGCRDFAGLAALSLASIYLQKALGLDARRTGFMLGTMMLLSVVVNPMAVWLSPGRRRLRVLAGLILVSAVIISTMPLWSVGTVLIGLCLFQAFQMSSYAVSDAAMLERVKPHVRGRVVGIFLTIAGTFAATSPWVMGFWTDLLGERAHEANAYFPIFLTLGVMLVIASTSMPLIAALGQPIEGAIEPITETTPATMEPVM